MARIDPLEARRASPTRAGKEGMYLVSSLALVDSRGSWRIAARRAPDNPGPRPVPKPRRARPVPVPTRGPSTDSGRVAPLSRAFAGGGLRTLFQPIVELSTRRVVACEALSRGPRFTTLESPRVLFEAARAQNQESLLDRTCALTALDNARGLGPGVVVFLNLNASTLASDPEIAGVVLQALDDTGRRADRLVVEIVGYERAWCRSLLHANLRTLREAGIRLAIDEVGGGSHEALLDVHPDYLKVGARLVRGLEGDPYRRTLLESLVALGSRLGIRLVAQGVETRAGLAALHEAGLELAQGFVLLPPLTAESLDLGGFLDGPAGTPPATPDPVR